jgi:hypothetical protein
MTVTSKVKTAQYKRRRWIGMRRTTLVLTRLGRRVRLHSHPLVCWN